MTIKSRFKDGSAPHTPGPDGPRGPWEPPGPLGQKGCIVGVGVGVEVGAIWERGFISEAFEEGLKGEKGVGEMVAVGVDKSFMKVGVLVGGPKISGVFVG